MHKHTYLQHKQDEKRRKFCADSVTTHIDSLTYDGMKTRSMRASYMGQIIKYFQSAQTCPFMINKKKINPRGYYCRMSFCFPEFISFSNRFWDRRRRMFGINLIEFPSKWFINRSISS